MGISIIRAVVDDFGCDGRTAGRQRPGAHQAARRLRSPCSRLAPTFTGVWRCLTPHGTTTPGLLSRARLPRASPGYEEVSACFESLRQRKVARVLFDESHGEAWSIRPEVAAGIRPEHPAASSYERPPRGCADRDFEVAALTEPLSDDGTGRRRRPGASPIRPSPSGSAPWTAVRPRSPPDEVERRRRFVERRRRAGGARRDRRGQVRQQPERAARARSACASTTPRCSTSRATSGSPTWVPASRSPILGAGAAAPGATQVCFYRAGTLDTHDGGTLLRTSADGRAARVAGLLARPRTATAASSSSPTPTCSATTTCSTSTTAALAEPHLLGVGRRLSLRARAASSRARPPRSALEAAARRDQRAARTPGAQGRGRPGGPRPRRRARPRRRDGREHRGARAPLSAPAGVPRCRCVADLRAWVEAGCAKPDFMASLALFRPEQHRDDGIEHLVVFPMYTPNGSPDTRFEALIVRTPWPEFIDKLERALFDNEKYVPVQLVDYTSGYDSECAVLFPETVSVADAADQQLRRASSATARPVRFQRARRPRCRDPAHPAAARRPPLWRATAISCARPTSSGT